MKTAHCDDDPDNDFALEFIKSSRGFKRIPALYLSVCLMLFSGLSANAMEQGSITQMDYGAEQEPMQLGQDVFVDNDDPSNADTQPESSGDEESEIEPQPESIGDYEESIATPSDGKEVLSESLSKTATQVGLSDEADVVHTESELEAWIQEHCYDGGTVSLGCSITITQPIWYHERYLNVVINTGEYGLIFDGGMLSNTEIQIIGEGVDLPVVTINDLSSYEEEGSVKNRVLELNITAAGRNGDGGTALRISNDISGTIDLSQKFEQGSIRSYGAGAVGIELAMPMVIYCFNAEVSGDSSRVVSAPSGSTLYYCKLYADGSGAAVVDDENIILDTCAAAPIPSESQYRSRYLLPESFDIMYLPFPQNGDPSILIYMDYIKAMLSLSGGDGYESEKRFFTFNFEYGDFNSVDISTQGKYSVPLRFSSAFQGLELDNMECFLTVEIRDPSLPCIEYFGIQNGISKFFFWESYDPEIGDVILWRSDDRGENWYNSTWSEDISWFGQSVEFKHSIQNQEVLFMLEIIDVGKSNIIFVSERGSISFGGSLGDRTGTDREGIEAPSIEFPSIEPPSIELRGDEDITDNESQSPNGGAPDNGGQVLDGIVKKEADSDSSPPIQTLLSTRERQEIALPDKQSAPEAEPVFSDGDFGFSVIKALDDEYEIAAMQDVEVQPMPANEMRPVDHEQTSPKPSFPIKGTIIALVGVAALFSGVLLLLRLRRGGR